MCGRVLSLRYRDKNGVKTRRIMCVMILIKYYIKKAAGTLRKCEAGELLDSQYTERGALCLQF